LDRDLLDKLTAWRRHLHAHPELGRHEKLTSAFVQEKLTELGVPFVANVGGHGVVATLTKGSSERTVGLRADMDALPIQEANDLPYKSKTPNVMHACGHDGHTTSLLGAAALLKADEGWSGTVQFVFQPAEEGAGGALAMLDDGVLERFPMERVFALHNWPGLEAGTVAVHRGPVMSEPGRFKITLTGKAGHAALPEQTHDPIVAMGHLIVALQTIVSRNVDPMESAVVSIGQVHGGLASNQIPTNVFIEGTFRTFVPAVRDRLLARLKGIAENIAATFEMTAEIEITRGGRGRRAARAARHEGQHHRRGFRLFPGEAPRLLYLDGQRPVGERRRPAQRPLQLQRRDPARRVGLVRGRGEAGAGQQRAVRLNHAVIPGRANGPSPEPMNTTPFQLAFLRFVDAMSWSWVPGSLLRNAPE
jgi:hippurate hydrolase